MLADRSQSSASCCRTALRPPRTDSRPRRASSSSCRAAYGERPAGVRQRTPAPTSCCRDSSTPTCTSTSRAAPSGRASSTRTRAAAAGGVTTLVDMPLNSIPPTTTVEGLEAKRAAARGSATSTSDSGAASCPATRRSSSRWRTPACSASSASCRPSGVDEFAHVGEADLREAMPVVARLRLPLLVHAELPALLRDPRRRSTGARSAALRDLAARAGPPRRAGGHRIVRARWRASIGARVHIVHLASADALPAIRAARAPRASR